MAAWRRVGSQRMPWQSDPLQGDPISNHHAVMAATEALAVALARQRLDLQGKGKGEARLPQEGLDWQGSRCNESRKEGLAALSEAAASEAAAALPCQRQASQPCRLPTPSESVSLAGQGLAALSQAQQPCQPTPSESALAALRVATPTAGPPPTHALATEAQPPTYSLADLWYMAVDPQPQQLPVEPGSCRCTPPHLGACPACPPSPSPTEPSPTEPPPPAAWGGRRACAGPGGTGRCRLQVHSRDEHNGHCCHLCLCKVGARSGGWHGPRCEGRLNFEAIIAGGGGLDGEEDAMRVLRLNA